MGMVWVIFRRRGWRFEPMIMSTTSVLCGWKWWKWVMAFLVMSVVRTEFGRTRIIMTIREWQSFADGAKINVFIKFKPKWTVF